MVRISLLDLALVHAGQTAGEALDTSLELARMAENSAYHRIWYSEHHNYPRVASATPAVLIAHIAAHTRRLRLGAGGVMLPNHSPLTVAEQFGLLETLHPGRIDLGLGRAPGTDQATARALVRSSDTENRFPEDVAALRGYLTGRSIVEGVQATPGSGTNVPLYILGSSVAGATCAASLGLPFAFASQFAPPALHEAVRTYRRQFRPSEQLKAPYVIAGINAAVSNTSTKASDQFDTYMRFEIEAARKEPNKKEAEEPANSSIRDQLEKSLEFSAIGTPAEAADYLKNFASYADADELMIVHKSPTADAYIRSARLLAEPFR
ncbi:LLM class flavin-dependent oxidoreductase [Streptomyces sp. NPDC059534]|uniref:LLM class flavin-dependent oxidoreductase n=1 Tax=Streptomyces sp. NPDC059534 TaxID=3346859 RepID=UPI00368DF937